MGFQKHFQWFLLFYAFIISFLLNTLIFNCINKHNDQKNSSNLRSQPACISRQLKLEQECIRYAVISICKFSRRAMPTSSKLCTTPYFSIFNPKCDPVTFGFVLFNIKCFAAYAKIKIS